MASPFLGMRGTGDWATDERPMSWRETILFLYPNGQVPLTAIMSKMKEESVLDPQYHWWTKKLPDQAGAVTLLYTHSDLGGTHEYTDTYPVGGTGAVAGATIYANVAEAVAKEFRVGHQVLLRDSDDFRVDTNALVTARTLNGSSSYLTLKFLETDDGGLTANNLVNCDRIMVIGNLNAEGATMPGAISYDPVKYSNYTQIFRTPLSITRTARLTKYRTGDKYREMKREALELHGIEMEKAFIWGVPYEATDSTTGKPVRATCGIRNFIQASVPANIDDYRLNATYHGKAWLDAGGGATWLDAYLEQVFRFGKGEKLALCGSGVLLGLKNLAMSGAHLNMEMRTTMYGIKVTEWQTPFGTIYLKSHPLMSQETSTRNTMIILEPENLTYRYITDTVFYGMNTNGPQAPGGVATAGDTYGARKDGTDEEFLTECGLELHHPDTFMILNGVGLAHP